MKINEIMTADPMCIEQDATIGTAISVMVEKKIRHLPVIDASGAVVGVITDRDLRCAALAPALEQYLSEGARRRLRNVGAALENLRVKDAMTCSPVTARPDMAVSQAAAIMLEMQVGSLPVIEDGKLVGIVTDRDAVKALAREVPELNLIPEFLW